MSTRQAAFWIVCAVILTLSGFVALAAGAETWWGLSLIGLFNLALCVVNVTARKRERRPDA